MKKLMTIVIALLLFGRVVLAQPAASESIYVPEANLDPSGALYDPAAQSLATEAQTKAFLDQLPAPGYFCFPEDRRVEVRVNDQLPEHWTKTTPQSRSKFRAKAQPNEYFTYQLGVFSPQKELKNVKLTFSELVNDKNEVIFASFSKCFNINGVDLYGNNFTRVVDIPKDILQNFWVGVRIPGSFSGVFHGKVTISADNAPSTEVAIELEVAGDRLVDGGIGQGWRMSRLQWLDSRIAQGYQPTAPYTSLKLYHRLIQYLGAEVELDATGLPAQITTHYDQSNQLDPTVSTPILSAPVALIIETTSGVQTLTPAGFTYVERNHGCAAWTTLLSNNDFRVELRGSIQFDGAMQYELVVTALKNVQVRDIRLEFPMTDYASKYMMGLGRMGRERPREAYQWKWDTLKHQDKVWLGNINAGMNLTFKDANYIRPLVNIYYDFGRLQYPNSWGNEGQGGITITPAAATSSTTLVNAYSGARMMTQGSVQHFNFDLRPTPVKPIDFKRHFTERFYHHHPDTSSAYIQTAREAGATMINIHHREDIYPFINYPFTDETVADLKNFVERASEEGLDTRVYYTCRELSVKVPEFWALRSFGTEIVMDGPGNETRTLIHPDGPKPWLRENLRSHYIPAWFNVFDAGRFAGQVDISIITTPDSRWNNYWLEGLNWMIKNMGLMGIYVDDTSLDGKTMQRARRLMDEDGRRRLIDMHTWNHMNVHAGYANSIQLYFELLPYVDRMWIGELFQDEHPRDFWLVEMSAIPFGLMSETLDANNLFRGMVFGMLPRLPWSGNPVPMWRLLDQFKISDARMLGYWDERNPISTDNELISATAYVRPGSAMVVMANWDNEQSQKSSVKIDFSKLGFTPKRIYCPPLEGSQQAAEVKISETLEISARSGVVWVIE